MQNFWQEPESLKMKVKHKKDNGAMSEGKHGSKFFNGLMWGAALGGSAAYVLSSKRRRDLVKDLIKEGIELLEKDFAPQKKSVQEALSPILEEEVVTAQEVGEQAVASEDENSTDKKRFFKKAAKK